MTRRPSSCLGLVNPPIVRSAIGVLVGHSLTWSWLPPKTTRGGPINYSDAHSDDPVPVAAGKASKQDR